MAVLTTRSACPDFWLDFHQILVRFGPDVDKTFGQVFLTRVFGQVWGIRKYSVQFYRDREIQSYSSTGSEEKRDNSLVF